VGTSAVFSAERTKGLDCETSVRKKRSVEQFVFHNILFSILLQTSSYVFDHISHHTCYTPTRNAHNKSNSSRYENGRNLSFFLAYSRDKV